jgi:hypothetical protein
LVSLRDPEIVAESCVPRSPVVPGRFGQAHEPWGSRRSGPGRCPRWVELTNRHGAHAASSPANCRSETDRCHRGRGTGPTGSPPCGRQGARRDLRGIAGRFSRSTHQRIDGRTRRGVDREVRDRFSVVNERLPPIEAPWPCSRVRCCASRGGSWSAGVITPRRCSHRRLGGTTGRPRQARVGTRAEFSSLRSVRWLAPRDLNGLPKRIVKRGGADQRRDPGM